MTAAKIFAFCTLATAVVAACTPAPTHTAPSVSVDASSNDAPDAAATARVSHREELLREAAASGMPVVFQGWLEPEEKLGTAERDTCLRVRIALSPDAGALPSLQLHEGTSARELTLRDAWTEPHCVGAGARLSLRADHTTEVVVVASAPLSASH